MISHLYLIKMHKLIFYNLSMIIPILQKEYNNGTNLSHIKLKDGQ